MTHEFICRSLPTEMCHASTVLPLADGGVLCAWFGGSREGAADVSIWLSRRENGVWQPPQEISAGAEAHWNPVLQQRTEQSIRLYFKVGAVIASWKTYFCESLDGGRTWDAPRELVPGDTSGGRGPVRSKLLRMASGRLLAPCSTENGIWTAYADRSEDNGITWERSSPIRIRGLYDDGSRTAESSTIAVSEQSFFGRGVIQPTLWEAPAGHTHMLLRSTEGYIYRSDSADGGIHWTDPVALPLPNNNSGIDLAQLPDGRLLLLCNPVGENWGARSPLRLLLSSDGGTHWEKLLDLDSSEGEFSYPAIVSRGWEVYITYTWKRENIAFWHLRVLTEE